GGARGRRGAARRQAAEVGFHAGGFPRTAPEPEEDGADRGPDEDGAGRQSRGDRTVQAGPRAAAPLRGDHAEHDAPRAALAPRDRWKPPAPDRGGERDVGERREPAAEGFRSDAGADETLQEGTAGA